MFKYQGSIYREAGHFEDDRREREFPPGEVRAPLDGTMGFTRDSVFKDPLYHGTDMRGLTELLPDLDVRGLEFGIYLTPNRRYARTYGSCIYTCYIDVQRPLYIESKFDLTGGESAAKLMTKQHVDSVIRDGYDSLVVTDEQEVVVFDPARVHVLTYEC